MAIIKLIKIKPLGKIKPIKIKAIRVGGKTRKLDIYPEKSILAKIKKVI